MWTTETLFEHFTDSFRKVESHLDDLNTKLDNITFLVMENQGATKAKGTMLSYVIACSSVLVTMGILISNILRR